MNREDEIAMWVSALCERSEIDEESREEIQAHLEDSVDELMATGLEVDEALLLAFRRFGTGEQLGWQGDFTLGKPRIWKILRGSVRTRGEGSRLVAQATRIILLMVLGFSLVLATLLATEFITVTSYLRLMPLVLFAGLGSRSLYMHYLQQSYDDTGRGGQSLPIAVGAMVLSLVPLLVMLYPYPAGSKTAVLSILHLPLYGWLMYGFVRDPRSLRESDRRMNFIRFSGEVLAYTVLIGTAAFFFCILVMLFALSLQTIPLVTPSLLAALMLSLLPTFIMIAVLLVERKQSLIENFAPVIARTIMPGIAVLISAIALLIIWTGNQNLIHKNTIVILDILLLSVIVAVIYSISLRSDLVASVWQDVLNSVIIAVSLFINAWVIFHLFWGMADGSGLSFSEASPYRLATIGSNMMLMVNLAFLLVLTLLNIRNPGTPQKLMRVQGNFLGIYLIWFGFIGMLLPFIAGFR